MKTIVYLYYAVATAAAIVAAAAISTVVAPVVAPVYVWCEMKIGDLGPPPVAESRSAFPPLWAGVALLCLLLTGCQFIAYQHNDYRVQADTPKRDKNSGGGGGGREFPGMFGLSPGIDELARLAGDDCWVAHSAGAARAVSLIRPGRCPRVLLLVDPWPPNIEVPDGPELVIVVTGRPGRVTVGPKARAVSKLRAAGACPWNWTVGHLYACRWPESVEVAREANSEKSSHPI